MKKLATSPYKKGAAREWVEAIVFAVFAAAFIRMFLIEAYVIPTSSMEGSLLVGDYLFVSKAHYGIRTPMTVLQVPLLHNTIPFIGSESYLTEPHLGYHRLPALQNVERNAPFVFNWPVEDSAIITPTYMYNMDMLRTNPGLKEKLAQDGYSDVTLRPVDKRDHYIKRCVALPNDVLEVRDRQVFVNGVAASNPKHLQWQYRVSGLKTLDNLVEMGVNVSEAILDNQNRPAGFHLNLEQVEKLRAMKDVKVELSPQDGLRTSTFPFDTTNFKWTFDNYGPIKMPAKGETVNLTPQNINLYQRIIAIYEGNTFEIKNGKFYIKIYFKINYIFKNWLFKLHLLIK